MLSQQQRQWFGYMREAPLVFVFYVCVCLPLIVLFSTQAPVVVNSQPQVMSVIEKVRPEYVDVEVLKRVPLFGVVDIPSPVIGPTIKVVEVIETALELTLRGLFTSTNKLAGQAIIAGEFDDKLYKVGESFEILPMLCWLKYFPIE
jgi:type II secretory pathway component PulC